jgi:nicotinamidase-related amidase
MSTALQKIRRAGVGLVVIDLQERLLPAVFESERLVQTVTCLVKGASILGLPVLVTEQYRKGLGSTIDQFAQLIPDVPFHKMTFSACGAEDFLNALRQKNLTQAILCGIEAHVCVTQTCLDLLAEGFRIFVAADAVSSRTAQNKQVGLERMRDAGAVIVSTEMILFELLEKAGTEESKQILALVK